MKRSALWAALWAAVLVPALAAGGARAATDRPSDPFLAAADGIVSLTVQTLAAASPDPDKVRQDQARWQTEVLAKARGTDSVRRVYQDRLTELRQSLFAIPSGSGCHRVAIPEVDQEQPCKVIEHGTVARAPGPKLEYWSQAYGKDPNAPRAVAQIVVTPDVKGAAGLVAVLSDAQSYQVPAIVQNQGTTFLHMLGHGEGTGDFPSRALFVWRDGRWSRLTADSWVSDLGKRLPRGLRITHGIYPDFATMTAKSDLWRADDPNCCPTGGTVSIRLRLEGDRIVLDHFTIARAPAN